MDYGSFVFGCLVGMVLTVGGTLFYVALCYAAAAGDKDPSLLSGQARLQDDLLYGEEQD